MSDATPKNWRQALIEKIAEACKGGRPLDLKPARRHRRCQLPPDMLDAVLPDRLLVLPGPVVEDDDD